MEESIDRDVPVLELAAAVNLSPSRFAHLFRRETGIPPARYLRDLR
jgi:transcriptional regulator GlxA family with amidase domain